MNSRSARQPESVFEETRGKDSMAAEPESRGPMQKPLLDVPTARHDRLAAENSYLMARLIEIETNLNTTLSALSLTIEQLHSVITPNMLPRMLTVRQVAELYQVAERTVNGWVFEGRIPHHRPGGALRFRLDELLEWSHHNDTAAMNVVALPRSKRLQPGKERSDAR